MLLIPQESTHVMPKKNPPMTDRAIKASTKPEISVGGCNNLKLRTDSSGRRWVLTVPTCRACGRRHNFGLGSYPEVSAKEARERGNEIHRDNRAGICRKEQKAVIRQQQREEAAKRMTYREACERFIQTCKQSPKTPRTGSSGTQPMSNTAIRLWVQEHRRDNGQRRVRCFRQRRFLAREA